MIRNMSRVRRCLVPQIINSSCLVLPVQMRPEFAKKTYSTLYSVRRFRSTNITHPTTEPSNIDPVVFEEVCNETLESLCDYFEEIIEQEPGLKGADVIYSDGVLTVDLGAHGTYVINRQSPNKQIWLSSPVSGPKRYDLILKDGGHWIYKHDGITLHKLLQEEISRICATEVAFHKCAHSLI